MPTRHRAALLAVLLCLPLAAHAGKGRLEITSEPGGAKVLINGEWRGNTSTDPAKPLVLPVPEGPYRVEAVIEATTTVSAWPGRLIIDACLPDHRQGFAPPPPAHPMQHRHLNHQRLTLAAIDDVIARGRWDDWAALRQAVLANPALLDKVEQVCRAQVADPYAQRHHFWLHYASAHRATA